MENKKKSISLLESFIPIIFLVGILGYNVFFVYGDNALGGSNQFLLLLGAGITTFIGYINKVPMKSIIE